MPGKGSSHSVDADIQNIREILGNYEYGFPILKELIQNADDAKARELNIGLLSGFPDSSHPLLRGPLLFAVNDGPFTKSNSTSLKNLGLSDKPSDFSAVGRFGIGLKSLFHLCEAFFFMGADDSGSVSGCDIYNPWSPQHESDEEQFHGNWDEAEIGYEELVEFLRQLLPEGPWSRSNSGWFCIWVPLRQKVHCSGIDSLVDTFPGDQVDPLEGILPADEGTEFSSILPMLLNLRSIRIWIPGHVGTQKLLSEFVLSDDSSRSAWNRSEDQILEEPNRFKGRILETGLVESESVFAGIEVCPKHLALAEYKRDESWPKRRGLSNTGTGVDIKEKAAPHAMVSFTRHPDSSGNGSLTTMWSVFLPLGAPEISECEIPLKISLSLHGYFFVDNGRTGIDLPSNSQNNNGPMTIRHRWNNDLLNDILLPQILPALEFFADAAVLSEEEISALTSLLSGSIARSNQYRSEICRDFHWIYRVLQENSSWSLIGREQSVLRVPEGPPDLICSVFPMLTAELSSEFAIVPEGTPTLANPTTGRWPDHQLQIALKPPVSIFDSTEQLEYFGKFLESRRSDIERFQHCHDQLIELLREVFSKIPLEQLRDQKVAIGHIISQIPRGRIFPITNDNTSARSLVIKNVTSLGTDVIFVPEELLPEIYQSNETGFSLTVNDAHKILDLLTDPPKDWLVSGYDRFRSNFAVRVLTGVGGEARDLLKVCSSHHLFFGQYIGERGAAVFSYHELVEAPDGLLLFSGTDRGLAEKLGQALAETETVLIPRPICLAIFGPGEGPSPCNPDSCIESIVNSKQLSVAPENRIPILGELLKFGSGLTDNEDSSWRKSVRFLLHGDYEHLDSNDMLFVEDPTTIDSVWSKLAAAALDFNDENWQVVPSCLANLIAHQHYDSLNLGDINRDSVVQFIRDRGPENISCDLLNSSERDQVVREIEDYTLLRGLRIHVDVQGVLQQIGPDTFIEDSFPSGDPLTSQIKLIAKIISNKELEFKQLQLVERRLWNAEAALEVAMNATNPSEYALSVMKGLRLIEGRIPSNLRQLLRDIKWLPAKNDDAVAPGYVVHISGLESQLAEVSKLSDGAVIGVDSLRSDFSDQGSLAILARHVFLSQPDTLTLIGMALGEIESFRIGLGRERLDSANFSTWISVFENLDEPLLPVVPILSSLLVGSDPQLTQAIRTSLVTELLQPISSTQYLSVLNRLAERHQSSDRANQDRIREIHSWYLQEATQAPEFLATILPKLLLRNKSGAWKPSAKLSSSVENISDDDVLEDAQFRIIQRYLEYQQIIPAHVNPVSPDQDNRIRAEFIEYIKEWEGPCPPLVLGAFAAILGDGDEIRKLSGQLLSEGSRSVDLVRGLFNWRPQLHRSTTGWIASEDINEVMSSQKFTFILEPGDPGAEVQIKSLLGFDFVAHLSTQIHHLIVGERNSNQRIPHSPVNSPITQERTAHIRIRMIDPINFQEQAQEIIKATAQVIWHEVFLQEGSLESVWADLGSDDQLGVLAAQTMIQESLFFHMGQLRMPENKTIDDLKNRWDDLRRQLQEKIHLDQLGHGSVSRANFEADKANLLKEMGTALESESGVQESFHQAVVKTLKDHQYGVHSIPFELFQNADDATAQLVDMQDKPNGKSFVVIEGNDSLTFVHWGRPINKFRWGEFEQKKYQSDLENMLVMHASGKSSRGDEEEVTGKFGLGFKSVFLACKNPRVLSGSIGFEVLGGVYPKILSSEIREELRSRIEDAHQDPLDATIIDFDLEHSDPTQRLDVLSRFKSLISVLHVFSRSIKQSEIYDGLGTHRSLWNPQHLRGAPNIEFGKISRADQTVPVLFFNCSHNAGILFSLTGKGLGRLDSNIPSLWVTTPTEEPSNVGFSMNGMFGIDPGRGRLNVKSPETEKATRELGYAIGKNFSALAQRTESDWENLRGELGLEVDASPYDFWDSVWDLLGLGLSESNATDASDLQIAKQIFWDPDSGAMGQIIRSQRVIPSGLSGDYSELVSLAKIKYQVDGCLNDRAIFEGVSSWPSFKTKHRPESLISRKFVGRPLLSLCPSSPRFDVITLKSALDGEFPNCLALPESAETIGKTISTNVFEQLEQGNLDERAEQSEIASYLSLLKFLSKSGSWCDPSSLVISEPLPGVDPDEPKRAAFAPDINVLATEYKGSGLDFFRLCRRQLNATSEDMANWALQVGNDDSKRRSVLDYLINGALNDPLGGRLHGSLQGTWLGSLDHQSPLMTGYKFFERYQIFGLLRIGQNDNTQFFPGQPTIHLTQRDATEVLSEISDWWKENRADEIRIYEESVYPRGVAPELVTDLGVLSHDVASREAWLETFILGSTFTMGRTKAEAHRNFVRQMRNDGWLTKFATPNLDPAELMNFLLGYFDHPNDRQDYYHWLRQFVTIFQLSRWLDDYAKIFLDLDKRGEFTLQTPLRNRRDYAYDFTGMNAPSLIPALGYGACFIVRELARQKALTSYNIHRYCYVPQARLRNLLSRLGCSGLDDGITTERSVAIFEFLKKHLGEEASFGGDFDLPLQVIASGKDNLWERFLGSSQPEESELEEIYDDE